MQSGGGDAKASLQFVKSFTREDHPELLLLTGGEPLLDPATVRKLAIIARRAGTRVCVISGMFFARSHSIPAPIQRAIAQVDHFTASMDEFHQAQVPLHAVIRCINQIRGMGVEVSIQATVRSADDPWLADLRAVISEESDTEIPMLLGTVGAVGRAKSFTKSSPAELDDMLQPCAFAAWPTVAWDGSVVACCNQGVVDGAVPEHLRLGHIAGSGWPAIRKICETRPMLRALRFYGPVGVRQVFESEPTAACAGYCETCAALPAGGTLDSEVRARFSGQAMRRLESSFMEMQQEAALERYSRGIAAPSSDLAPA